MKFIYLVWRNLMRKKLRTTLTILSILVAFLLFGILATIKQSLTGGATVAGADRLIVRHKVSIIQPLPVTYESRIRRVPGVADVVHISWFGGIYQDPKNFFPSYPVEPESYLRMYPEILVPDDQKKAWLQTRTGAIVGRTTAETYGFKVGDRVPLNSPIWTNKSGGAWEFDIVGIYDGAKKATDTTGFLFRYDYFDEGREFGVGLVGWFGVRIDDPEQAAEISNVIDLEFANSPAETKAEPEGAFVQGFANQIGDIASMVMAIVGAVFFTILLVAGNTMAQSVRERTEELGVLKAMGFTNELVLGTVLGESVAIACIGGFSGLTLSWMLTLGGSPAPSFLAIWVLPGSDIVLGVILAIGLGLIAGILPAMQAMRLRIAVALRTGA